ncbi:ABC transporter permease [Maricaulis salignorans]|uniref:Putative ABC transport system permease protein n=1 Tax=Maricaulis salignorans TaxID=144026 RepID=A0A1G9W868_9PROT|nr:ABC transporter permease [Maricaulis salignorans]SDM80702.1 putative ABC transport system permease protein [Maricaulis salignorans]
MNLLASIRVALTALRINALRSSLAMLGVIIGVASVIVLVSISEGTKQAVEAQIASFGANLLIVRPGASIFGGRRGAGGTGTPVTDADAEAIRDQVSGIDGVSGEVNAMGLSVVFGGVNWSTRITGVNPSFFGIRDWTIEEGRAFSVEEEQSARRLAVVGQTIIDEVFDGASPVGQSLRIGGQQFEVIGTVAAKGETSFGSDQDDIVFAPLSTVRQRFGASETPTVRDPVQTIYVAVGDGENTDRIIADIQDLLRIRRDIQPGADDDFSVASLAEFIRARNETESQLGLLLAVGAGIVLLVGGIGIMNIMLVSVTERTREIGLRLAVGARASDIRNQFLIESIVLCVTGGLVGLVVGVGGTIAYANVGELEISVNPGIVAVAIGASAFVGVFFGLYPAHRAARLNPIEALRFE